MEMIMIEQISDVKIKVSKTQIGFSINGDLHLFPLIRAEKPRIVRKFG